MALGAFLAGMMLGESQFRHQIESDIRPFRDLLLGLFFISVGMLVDPALVVTFWHWILLAAAALLLIKGVLISLMLKGLGEAPGSAIRAGTVLAQAGEFGFVLVTLAVRTNCSRPTAPVWWFPSSWSPWRSRPCCSVTAKPFPTGS